MSNPSFCWWCGGKLVGKGGIAGRQPLFFREVKYGALPVRVHVKCEEETKKFFRFETAQPTSLTPLIPKMYAR